MKKAAAATAAVTAAATADAIPTGPLPSGPGSSCQLPPAAMLASAQLCSVGMPSPLSPADIQEMLMQVPEPLRVNLVSRISEEVQQRYQQVFTICQRLVADVRKEHAACLVTVAGFADGLAATQLQVAELAKAAQATVRPAADSQQQPDQFRQPGKRPPPAGPPRPAAHGSAAGARAAPAGDRQPIGSSYELTKSNVLTLTHVPDGLTKEAVLTSMLQHVDDLDGLAAAVVVEEKTWGKPGGSAQPTRAFEFRFPSHMPDCWDVRARMHNALGEVACGIRSSNPACTRCFPDYALTQHGRERRNQLQGARAALIAKNRPPVWRNGVELWAPVAPGVKRNRALVTAAELAALVAAPLPAADGGAGAVNGAGATAAGGPADAVMAG